MAEGWIPGASKLATAVTVLAFVVAASGCGSSDKSGGGGKDVVLRVGTTEPIPTLNPWNANSGLNSAQVAQGVVYPGVVQYGPDPDNRFVSALASKWETSTDGKTWTFDFPADAKWSDGKPLTAEDAAWTLQMSQKYATSATGFTAQYVQFIKSASAPEPTKLVIETAAPLAPSVVLGNLTQLHIVPKHIWEPVFADGAKAVPTFNPAAKLPVVSGGPYEMTKYNPQGDTVLVRNQGFTGPAPGSDAVVISYFANPDAQVEALRRGTIDWAALMSPSTAKAAKSIPNVTVTVTPGSGSVQLSWNSNPYKERNRELLDPAVRRALSMCIDRDKINQIVFGGYGKPIDTYLGPPIYSGQWLSPEKPDAKYDCAEGNRLLDELGFRKGSDGLRVAPATSGSDGEAAHPMRYVLLTPGPGIVPFNENRLASIVSEGLAEAGVEVRQKIGGDVNATVVALTGDKCGPKTGYQDWDMSSWIYGQPFEPSTTLAYFISSQRCVFNDSAHSDPEYDKLFDAQNAAATDEERQQAIWRMQEILYADHPYTNLINQDMLDAYTDSWTGFQFPMWGRSWLYLTSPHPVGD